MLETATDTPQKTSYAPAAAKPVRYVHREAYRRGDGSGVPLTYDPHYMQRLPASSYQDSLFGAAGTDGEPHWSDSGWNRFWARGISRGIFGALAFTAGAKIAHQQLQGYSHTAAWNFKKPLQIVAKGFDVTFGKAIQTGVKSFARFSHTEEEAAKIAEDFVTFRQSRKFGSHYGRSFGAEMVSVSFDFAMMSVGDAIIRNLIQVMDPNVKKTWLVNDKGLPAGKNEEKHFVFSKWVQSVGDTGWRIFSKNQGEDWAAGLFYIFQMKWGSKLFSNVFNKRYAGSNLAFDRGWNGGAHILDESGKVIGDDAARKVAEFVYRFTSYNWYTLMYREGYDAVANKFHKWQADGYPISAPQLPDHLNPITATVDAIGGSLHYGASRLIKATLYMIPSSLLFGIIRVPQTAHHTGTITPEAIATGKASKLGDAVPAKDYFSPHFYDHYRSATFMDKFDKGVSKLLRPIARFTHSLGEGFADWVMVASQKGWLPQEQWFHDLVKNDKGDYEKGLREFAHNLTDSGLAYWLYIATKAQLGLQVDDSKSDGTPGKMDKAIDHFIHHMTSFQFDKAAADMKTMWALGTNFEREIKSREGETVKDPEKAPVVPAAATQPAPAVIVVAPTVLPNQVPVVSAPALAVQAQPQPQPKTVVTGPTLKVHQPVAAGARYAPAVNAPAFKKTANADLQQPDNSVRDMRLVESKPLVNLVAEHGGAKVAANHSEHAQRA